MPGNEGTTCFSTGSRLDVEAPGRDGRVDHHHAGDPVGVVGGQLQRERAAHRQPADDDGVVVEAEPVEDAATSPYQSSQRVVFISCQVVPWPGSRGTSTAYPSAPRGSPQGLTDAGGPVKPWLSSTPTRRPPVSSGRAGIESGVASGWIVMGAL